LSVYTFYYTFSGIMSIFFKQKAPDRVYFINKIVYYTLKGIKIAET